MTDNCNVCVHIVQFWSVNKIYPKKINIYIYIICHDFVFVFVCVGIVYND